MPSSRSPKTVVNPNVGPKLNGGGSDSANALLLGHLADPVAAHAASAITYDGGPAWADTTTNPAATVEAQLDKILTDLGSGDGAGKIAYNGGVAWADGTTNPAATLGVQIDKILSDLSASTGSPKIGAASYTGARFNLGAGTIRSQLIGIADQLSFAGDHVLTSTGFPLNFSAAATAHISGPVAGTLEIYGGTGSVATRLRDGSGLQLATLPSTGMEFFIGSSLKASIDTTGIGIDSTSTPSVRATADNNARFTIGRNQQSGSVGGTPAAAIRLEGQTGRAGDNDGGAVELYPGRPGGTAFFGPVLTLRGVDAAGSDLLTKEYHRSLLNLGTGNTLDIWTDPDGTINNGDVVYAEVTLLTQRVTAEAGSNPGAMVTATMIWGRGSTGTFFTGPNYAPGTFLSEIGEAGMVLELQHAVTSNTAQILIENTGAAAAHVFIFIKTYRVT